MTIPIPDHDSLVIGSVLPFPEKAPEGWIALKGAFLSRKEHPKFWAAIRNAYNDGNIIPIWENWGGSIDPGGVRLPNMTDEASQKAAWGIKHIDGEVVLAIKVQ